MAVARYDLGLTLEEFYNSQPRQLDALVRRQERESHKTEFLFAQMGSLIVNFSMSRPKQPIEPRDLMPSEWGKKLLQAKKLRNRQFIATEIRGVMEGMRKAHGNGE